MRPSVSRNATRSSPSSLTRTGGESGSAISHDRQAGIQYRRIALPIGVPGPTRVISSFSFGGSIGDFLLVVAPDVSIRATQTRRRIAYSRPRGRDFDKAGSGEWLDMPLPRPGGKHYRHRTGHQGGREPPED